MFPLKAAFTPKDSSRWFAFNSRLQGATPSSWPGLSLEREGTGWHWEQGWGRAGSHTHPWWAVAVHTCTPFLVQNSKDPHPLAELIPTAAHFLFFPSPACGEIFLAEGDRPSSYPW